MKYPAIQGNPNQEIDHSSQFYFQGDIGLQPNDSTSAPDTTSPGGSTLSVNGKFIRVTTTGILRIWNSTTSLWIDSSNSAITALSQTVDTYAEMVAYPKASLPITFLVLQDENKVQENTIYQHFPNPSGDPTLMWVAAIKEII